ncbi:MAG: DUF4781 domain-containing protein [Deltaproteobacteria bacterium]
MSVTSATRRQEIRQRQEPRVDAPKTKTADAPTTSPAPEAEATTAPEPRRVNAEARPEERRAIDDASTRLLRDRIESDLEATSLMTEELDDGEENCLEHAVEAARPGQDDVVFMEDRRSAEDGNADGAGHALVRDRETGEVTDPTTGASFATTDEWIEAQGVGADGGPAYIETAAVAAETVQDVLSVPPEERAERIAAYGDPQLNLVANAMYADSTESVSSERRAEIREHVEENLYAGNVAGADLADALLGDSELGELTEAEQQYLVEQAVDGWIDDDELASLNYGVNEFAWMAEDHPELREPVSRALAESAVERRGDFPDEHRARDEAAVLAIGALEALESPEERRALIDDLGADAAGLVTALEPSNGESGGPWRPSGDYRWYQAAALVEAAALGEPTEGSAAVTQAAFEQMDERAYDVNPTLARDMGQALANHWYPDDADLRAQEAERFGGILATDAGLDLLAGEHTPPAARAEMLALFRTNEDLDASMLEDHDGNGWSHPEVMRRLAAPAATDFLELRGDEPQVLSGSHLDNTVGFAMGFPPTVPEGESDAEIADREAAIAAGEHSLYADGEFSEDVEVVTDAIREVGGDDAEVTVLPIFYSTEATGQVQIPLFRVQDEETGEDRFVDNIGRTYDSFDDWRSNNKLPPGYMTYPVDGHLEPGAEDRPRLGSRNTPETVDTFGERAFQFLDTAALVGGTIAGGLLLVGSGGTAAPFVLGGASLYGALRTADRLNDRYQHGQSINPLTDSGARSEWLALGADALGFASAGTTAIASRLARGSSALTPFAASTASALNIGASVADGLAVADAGHTLLTQWDELDGAQRAQLGLSMAFWGAQAAARPSVSGARPGELFDFDAMRGGIIRNGRRANDYVPHPTNFESGALISQNFDPTFQHMFGAGTIGTRSRGINGGHYADDFASALSGQGTVTGRQDVPGFPGIEVVDYRLYTANPDGTINVGTTSSRPQTKTVFDPDVWSSEEIDRLMSDVFGDVTGNGTVTRVVNGVEFIGWVRNGELQSFGINQ